ncbi:MAG: TetR/AcrR family transcriptional regulator [Actinobacteria bacterium]|nr:TetR/AcrR family transcriptional regulator [Actinomycetota bacterium]MBU1943263.1 TetR/AcrR family transcriptional regulator [Actinomycetota bacterium]MBU2688988.1 TetR/AcrR family transcriptional regulator [Actinomycetota bacterium]
MTPGDETRARIIDEARERFFTVGYNKVRMDDLASALGISKKTLYKNFGSKENLLFEVVADSVSRVNAEIDLVLSDVELDFMEKLGRLAMIAGFELSRIGQPLIDDIEHRFPGVQIIVCELKKQQFDIRLSELLRQGVASGVFRPEVDPRILGLVISNSVFDILSPPSLARLDMNATGAFVEIARILFAGIVTDEARPDLEPRLDEMRDTFAWSGTSPMTDAEGVI